ncbi:Hypothetical predicted protein [Mytilus galloprovincialis]|uniref:ZP domain-containing protein n=1 Tax=Mytilus galloprovincialis TaxID=29158 RepID=A0A8B6GUK1_MYTGA|nr:Hypothetical predicted protein [Mytilus galloprovincialis]
MFVRMLIINILFSFEACGTNGIKSIDTDHLEKVYILLNEATHVYCNPKNKNLKDCFKTTNTDVPGELKVLYEEALTPHIVGGKQVHYFHLVCKDKPRVMNATASFSNITYYGNYTDTVKNIVIDGSLTLKISGNPDNHDNTDNIKDVEVGQSLYLFLSGPAEHKISPKECTAKSLTMNNPEEVPLWKTNALCDDFDPNIIDQKWTTKTDKLSIRMYAFRFDSSDEVTITCTAFVCSVSDQSPNCTQVCVNSQQHNSVRRRRNAIVGPQLQHAEKSASASFRIVKRDTSNAAAGKIFF